MMETMFLSTVNDFRKARQNICRPAVFQLACLLASARQKKEDDKQLVHHN